VADWRLGWGHRDQKAYRNPNVAKDVQNDQPSETDLAFLAKEPADIQALIQATAAYRQNGKLPGTAHDAPLPGLVATQTVYERDKGKPVR
ncbi:effector protein Tle3 domain-containing protein, partial [Paraburkholderia tropica]